MHLIKVNDWRGYRYSIIPMWIKIVIGIVIVIAIWQIANYDFCPLYYGIKCLPQ